MRAARAHELMSTPICIFISMLFGSDLLQIVQVLLCTRPQPQHNA